MLIWVELVQTFLTLKMNPTVKLRTVINDLFCSIVQISYDFHLKKYKVILKGPSDVIFEVLIFSFEV